MLFINCANMSDLMTSTLPLTTFVYGRVPVCPVMLHDLKYGFLFGQPAL